MIFNARRFILLTVSGGNIQQLPKSLKWHLVAFLDVYGNADIDTCTLLQMPVLFILHYWLMKLQEEKKHFFSMSF